MALVRGKEVFAQVFVAAGKNTVNRRIHRIEIHRGGLETLVFEGKNLPHLVYLSTVNDEQGQNGAGVNATGTKRKWEFLMDSKFTEFLAQIVVSGEEKPLNRRIHRIEIHREGLDTQVLEGKQLPRLVHVNTTRNEQGQNVMQMFAAPSREATSFSTTTLFLALVSFVGLCTYVIVAAINEHRCL